MRLGFFRNLAACLLVSVTLAAPAMAENAAPAPTPEAVADLAFIRAKAASSRQLLQTLDQLQSMIKNNDGPMADDQNLELFLGNIAGVRDFARLPVNIVAVTQIPVAQRRAQIIGEVLMADLDGDWAVTRQELQYALASGRTQRAAEMFIAGDTDGDNTLSTAEVKDIVSRTAQAENGQRSEGRNLLAAFDLDGDGNFTQDEFRRAMAALKG